MPSADTVDSWAGWSIMGFGVLVGYAAWKNVDGGAIGLIKDVITTGTIPRSVGAHRPASETGMSNPDAVTVAIEFARQQIGKPYKWSSTGPDSWDCSSLVQAAYAAAGVKIPRTTYGQLTAGNGVPTSEAPQPGDLVFTESGGHVMLAIGGGQAIEAPHTGDFVKTITVPAHPFAIRRVV